MLTIVQDVSEEEKYHIIITGNNYLELRVGALMNFITLKRFVDLAELKNYTKVAHQDYISQPALSKQIKEMEAEIGVQLFSRDHHHVELTRQGQQFLTTAKSLLSQYQKGLIKLHQSVGTKYHLKAILSLDRQFHGYMEQLMQFKSAFPDVDVQIEKQYAPQATKAVIEHNADIGFGVVQPIANLQWNAITTDSFMIVINHQQAMRFKQPVNLKQLNSMQYFYTDEPAGIFNKFPTQIIKESGVEFSTHKFADVATVLNNIKIANAFTIMPNSAITDDPELAVLTIQTKLNPTFKGGWCSQVNADNPAVNLFLNYLPYV